MIREFHLSPRGQGGVSCDDGGAFVGPIPILYRLRRNGKDEWRPRDCDGLSEQMSARYGLPTISRRAIIPRSDAILGNLAFDTSLRAKSARDAWIKGFFSADFAPAGVVIVRPNQLGDGSSYVIWRTDGN